MTFFKKKINKFSDEELMGFIQQGESYAFDELYNRYSKRLLFYFYRMLGNDEEKAQDFLQDIFLKIIDKQNAFNSINRFSSWVFTIAYNMCKNEYRRLEVRKNTENKGNLDYLPASHENNYLQIEKKTDHNIFKETLFAELESLNVDKKTTFLLRYLEELSIKEISKIMNCSEGTIKSRLHYITKNLTNTLHSFNPNNSEV